MSEKETFMDGFEEVQRGFLWKKGRVISCRGVEDGEGRGSNSGKSGTRNLKAESIGSRAETTGGCVKLTTFTTEIRRSRAKCT